MLLKMLTSQSRLKQSPCFSLYAVHSFIFITSLPEQTDFWIEENGLFLLNKHQYGWDHTYIYINNTLCLQPDC